jgi:hypothetical protein
MATATIPHARPVRPQRRRPDDLCILQLDAYETRERRPRGTSRHAGDMLVVSDETVRRIVHAAALRSPANAEASAAGRADAPPPFAAERATWRGLRDVPCHTTPPAAPQPAGTATTPMMLISANRDALTGADVASAVATSPQTDDATRHTDEPPEGSPAVPPTPQPAPPPPQLPSLPPDPDPDLWPLSSPEDPMPPE